jgi:hypothetical protein
MLNRRHAAQYAALLRPMNCALPRWKNRRAGGKRPENLGMFSGVFAAFVEGIQKTAAAP